MSTRMFHNCSVTEMKNTIIHVCKIPSGKAICFFCIEFYMRVYGKNVTLVTLSKLLVFFGEFLGQMMNKWKKKR